MNLDLHVMRFDWAGGPAAIGPGVARLARTAEQLVAAQSYTMVYENDAWKLEPAAEGLALYKLGAAKAIAAQKKAGTCANS